MNGALRRAAGVLAALVALGACGDPAVVPGGGSVEGRTFLSQSVTGRELVAGTQIRLTFQERQLGAHAGCNSLGAAYSVEGGELVVEGEGLVMTEIGCDEARHAQDDWLAGILTSKPAVALDEDTLTLTSGTTVIRLLDRKVADPDRPLAGTTWRVDTVIDGETASSVPEDAAVTLVFEDARFTVTAEDCTSAAGPVEVGAGTLTFGDFAVDDVGCPGPWAETLEVLRAGETTYEIEAGRLTIRAPDAGISALAEPR